MKRHFAQSTFLGDAVRIRCLLTILFVMLLSACAKLPRQAITQIATDPNESLATSRINLNTASTVELEQLPGVGKVLAERIIDYRNKYGPFRRPAHLMMVRGISERKFLELQSMITVE